MSEDKFRQLLKRAAEVAPKYFNAEYVEEDEDKLVFWGFHDGAANPEIPAQLWDDEGLELWAASAIIAMISAMNKEYDCEYRRMTPDKLADSRYPMMQDVMNYSTWPMLSTLSVLENFIRFFEDGAYHEKEKSETVV